MKKTILTLAAVSCLALLAKNAEATPFVAGPAMAYAIIGGMGVALATDGHNKEKPFVDGAALASGRMDIMTADKSRQAIGYNESKGLGLKK